MIWLLILMSFVNGNDSSVDIHSIEFPTKNSCQFALKKSKEIGTFGHGMNNRSIKGFCMELKK